MSTHTNHTEINQSYFCTITCYQWLPLFKEANAYEAVYRWFAHLKKDGCQILGYVIMPNHIHVLLFPTSKSLNKLVSEGKRFMAYDIVARLEQAGKVDLLSQLQQGVDPNERAKGKKHQVFKLSFDARVCDDERTLLQRLDYTHHNPVNGKWNLADDFVKYPHSSASYYETGEDERKIVTHYREVNASESSASDSDGRNRSTYKEVIQH